MTNSAQKVAAIAAVLLEREQQDEWYNNRKSVAEEVLLLNRYIRKAENAWVDNTGDIPALHEIRKIAAIALRCLENNGAPLRQEWKI